MNQIKLSFPKWSVLFFLILLWAQSTQASVKTPYKIAFIPQTFKDAFIYLARKDKTSINIADEMQKFEKEILKNVEEEGLEVSSKDFKFNDDELNTFFFSIPIPNRKDVFDADLFLWSSFDLKKHKLEIQIASVETLKVVSYVMDLTNMNERDLNFQLNETIKMLLNQKSLIDEILSFKADKIIDPYNSIVLYEFSTTEGRVLNIKIDYDGAHQVIQAYGSECKEHDLGQQKYVTLKSDDGHELYFQCDAKGASQNIKTNYHPSSSKEKKTFVITNKKGYALNVDLEWNDDRLQLNGISPVEHPYFPYIISIGKDKKVVWLNEYPPDE